jgi:hypothetical protein
MSFLVNQQPSPLPAGCNPSTVGTLFPNTSVEPQLAVNTAAPMSMVAVFQQDRWSNGGANAVLGRVSLDGGDSWFTPATFPPFSHCAGGNAANGGDYDRASNAWTSFSKSGTAYVSVLGLSNDILISSIMVASSSDSGVTWGPITTLARDDFTATQSFNDRDSVTADPTDRDNAYLVWTHGQLTADNHLNAFTYLSRTTNGGATWEPARAIFTAPVDAEPIGSRIVVLPNGTLVHVFTLIVSPTPQIRVQRSTDHGLTWSADTLLNTAGTARVKDPRDNAPVRTEEILAYIAVDPRPGRNNVYAVWQDARFTGGTADAVALSKSSDGGLTWSTPSRVSAPESGQAFNPAVVVDSRGVVLVTYYDFTFDTIQDIPLNTDFWATESDDDDVSFDRRKRITATSFDLRQAPRVSRGFFLGDNSGLAAIRRMGNGDFEAVYPRVDNPSGFTDIYSVRIAEEHE